MAKHIKHLMLKSFIRETVQFSSIDFFITLKEEICFVVTQDNDIHNHNRNNNHE